MGLFGFGSLPVKSLRMHINDLKITKKNVKHILATTLPDPSQTRRTGCVFLALCLFVLCCLNRSETFLVLVVTFEMIDPYQYRSRRRAFRHFSFNRKNVILPHLQVWLDIRIVCSSRVCFIRIHSHSVRVWLNSFVKAAILLLRTLLDQTLSLTGSSLPFLHCFLTIPPKFFRPALNCIPLLFTLNVQEHVSVCYTLVATCCRPRNTMNTRKSCRNV